MTDTPVLELINRKVQDVCLNASKKKRESVNACDSEVLAGRAACSLQHPKNAAWHQIWHVGIFLVAKKAAYTPKPMNQRARSHVHIAHMCGFKSLLVMRLTSFSPPLTLTPAVATSARYICQDNRAFRRHGSTIYRLSGTIMPRLKYTGFCTAPPADIVSSLWT